VYHLLFIPIDVIANKKDTHAIIYFLEIQTKRPFGGGTREGYI